MVLANLVMDILIRYILIVKIIGSINTSSRRKIYPPPHLPASWQAGKTPAYGWGCSPQGGGIPPMEEMQQIFCFGDVARNVFCEEGPREAQAKRGYIYQFGT